MSSLVTRWRVMMTALTDTRLHRSEIAVLAAILDRMDKTGQAWPSMSTIAKDATVSRGQVIKVIPRLKELGYLLVDSGNREVSNTYRMGSPLGRLEASTPRRSEASTRRRPQASKVDACRASEVDAPRRPEPALQATSTIEPEKRPPADAASPRKAAAKKITYGQWVESKPEGTMLIPGDDPIFDYAEEIGMPHELLRLHWKTFADRYQDNPKRYTDWRAVFRNSVRDNWFRLWYISDADGSYQLTTLGKQADRLYRMGIAA